MLKTFKWLWKLAYQRGEDIALFEIRTMAQYHYQQAQIQTMRDKYEPPKASDSQFYPYMKELTADQHSAIANALEKLERRISPPIIETHQEIMMDPALMQPPKVDQ